MRIRQGVYTRPIESRFGQCAPGIEKSPQALSELWGENGRLKRAVADLTLDKLILEEAAKGNF